MTKYRVTRISKGNFFSSFRFEYYVSKIGWNIKYGWRETKNDNNKVWLKEKGKDLKIGKSLILYKEE